MPRYEVCDHELIAREAGPQSDHPEKSAECPGTAIVIAACERIVAYLSSNKAEVESHLRTLATPIRSQGSSLDVDEARYAASEAFLKKITSMPFDYLESVFFVEGHMSTESCKEGTNHPLSSFVLKIWALKGCGKSLPDLERLSGELRLMLGIITTEKRAALDARLAGNWHEPGQVTRQTGANVQAVMQPDHLAAAYGCESAKPRL